jgi:hypothetical protein
MPTAEGPPDATTEDQAPAIEPQKRALHTLTTDELEARRRELIRAIKGISVDAPMQADLRRWLDEVPAEEKNRAGSADA